MNKVVSDSDKILGRKVKVKFIEGIDKKLINIETDELRELLENGYYILSDNYDFNLYSFLGKMLQMKHLSENKYEFSACFYGDQNENSEVCEYKFNTINGAFDLCEVKVISDIRSKLNDMALSNGYDFDGLYSEVEELIYGCPNYENIEILHYIIGYIHFFKNDKDNFDKAFNYFQENLKEGQFIAKIRILNEIFSNRNKSGMIQNDFLILSSDNTDPVIRPVINAIIRSGLSKHIINDLQTFINTSMKVKLKFIIGHGSDSKPNIKIKRNPESKLEDVPLSEVFHSFSSTKCCVLLSCDSDDFNPNLKGTKISSIIKYDEKVKSGPLVFSLFNILFEFNSEVSNNLIFQSTREGLYLVSLTKEMIKIIEQEDIIIN